MFSTAKKFVHHVMPGVIRPIHILWNQVIGFFFFVLAILPAQYIVRAWRDGSDFRLAVYGTFSLVMAIFGIDSFRRARKISKS
ncbi:MAG TPA: hypothetical protein VME17_17390 [Bryobacteraceae bacterium]|nr:hypothetical protein [Bryobacteraceae bacterium]